MESLLAAAAERAGLDDFGDDWFLRPLAAWADDLDDGVLNDAGRSFFTRLAVRDLERRLRVFDVLARNPEIADVEIPPIVYITGLTRSGTTLLHNLLAQHELARPLLRWELMEPVPPPEAHTYGSDPRIARVQASVDKRRGSILERMHWVNADEPEECQWAFVDFVSLLGGAAGGAMLRWGAFVASADFTPVFRNYRSVLKLLLWKNPVPADGFLVLKAPQISPNISELAAVFPEARFVIPDRDPYRVLRSLTAMVGDILEPLTIPNPLPAEDPALEHLRYTERALAAIARHELLADRAPVHVAYPALATDPSRVTANVFAELGLNADPALAAKIDGFIDAQRSGARLAPPSSLPKMTLTRDTIVGNPTIAEYCRLHGIEPETNRLTGAHSGTP